ncbi:MAG: hypothetical protein U0T77_07460 [Chitinophagales bacterium]
MVKHLIYPVPDPNFPFLGVHFTRFIQGGVEAGPNAVLAYAREGYHKSDIVWKELFESITYKGFLKSPSRTGVPASRRCDAPIRRKHSPLPCNACCPNWRWMTCCFRDAGVRSAMDRNGNVVDDFIIEKQGNIIHVLNTPSPAATASLSIGLTIAEMAWKELK